MADVPIRFRAFLTWNDLKKGLEDANKSLEKAGDAVKDFGREQRVQARNARLFANELGAFVPAGNSAAKAMTELGASLLGGIGIGTGFEVAKIAIGFFSEQADEAKRKSAELAAEITNLGNAIRNSVQAQDLSRLAKATDPERASLEKDRLEAVKHLDEAERAARKQKREEGINTVEALGVVGAAKDELARAEAAITAWAEGQRDKSNAYLDEINRKANENATKRGEKEDEIIAKRLAAELEIGKIRDEWSRPRGFREGDPGWSQTWGLSNPVRDQATGNVSPAGWDLPSQRLTGMDFAGNKDSGLEWTPADLQKKWKAEQEAMARELKTAEDQAKASGAVIGEALAGAFTQGEAGAIQFGKVVLDQALLNIQAKTAEAAAAALAANGWNPIVAAGAVAAMFAMGRGLIAQLPAREFGGPVYGGQPYLVGERGPEVVVPGSSGTVIPNKRLGGMTVNVTATDSRSFARMLSDPGSELHAAFRTAARMPRV